jgi:hypothetical protein
MTHDLAEVLANAIVGLAVSWAATWAVLGFSPVQSVGVTAMFFALSTARQFVLRRLFRRLA